MVQNRFRSSINRAQTQSFPGADVGSDHDMIMMNFRLRLKKIRRLKNARIKFDLEKLKDPNVAEEFKAVIGGKFALLNLAEEEVKTMTNNFNSTVTDTTSKILGKHRQKKKPWVTGDLLEMCDKQRQLKKDKSTTEVATKYREINNAIKMKRAKENWIEEQCNEIENNINKNNSKRAFQIVNNLTEKRLPKTSSIQEKDGKLLTEGKHIINRWTEYCSDLYNHQSNGDPSILNCPQANEDDDFPVPAAIKSLMRGKAAGIDNIPSELIKAAGEAMIDALTIICNKVWKLGEWTTIWTQSLVITVPKKGNRQLCQNHRHHLISHPSKVMLK